MVSQLGVRDGLLWCSGIGIPAGLVGTVCTDEPYRGQGIGAQLMGAALVCMKRFKLAISYLHTSTERYGFYSRLGYKKTIIQNPRLIIQLNKLDLDTKQPHIKTRVATFADAEALNAIYQIHYGQCSGAWSSAVAFWQRRLQQQPKLWSPQPMTFYVAGHDSPLAYLAINETNNVGLVSEWACRPGSEDIAMALLYNTCKAWYQRGVQVAQLTISTHHPLWPQAQMLVSEDQTSHSDIWVRIQDRDRFVQHIRPQLEERARAADLKLTICFTEDGNVLEFGHGKPVALRLTASDLCALVYNGRRLLGLLTVRGNYCYPGRSPSTGSSLSGHWSCTMYSGCLLIRIFIDKPLRLTY